MPTEKTLAAPAGECPSHRDTLILLLVRYTAQPLQRACWLVALQSPATFALESPEDKNMKFVVNARRLPSGARLCERYQMHSHCLNIDI